MGEATSTGDGGGGADPRRPRSRYLEIGAHELHWTEWGTPGSPAVVMWHGLARTGRDFDTLAEALADRFYILAPDTIGRGLSSWSRDPDADYCLARYAEHARALMDGAGLARAHWVGTSMGGALAIRAATTTLAGRLDRVVLNDIGPTLPPGPTERIRTYVGKPPEFASVREIEVYFRSIYEPFGLHTDAQWRHMAETSLRRLPNGKLTTHYDPAIVRQFFAHPEDFEQWTHWDRLERPTLVLRGVTSDVLPSEVAAEMTRRGPRAEVVEVPGCGHAPALNVAEQIAIVGRFLGGEGRA
jgi:pimeloyl-ACP methyl ester carboxylesterase